MKDEFDFPMFKDLQLGPVGDLYGCGCLCTRMDEVQLNSDMTPMEHKKFSSLVRKAVGGRGPMSVLTHWECPNTLANRRKAYRALEQATREIGYEIGAP